MAELNFRSHGPHPYVLFAAPFGLILVSLAVTALFLAPADAGTAFGVIGAFAFGTWVMLSCAFSVWGSVTLRRDGDRCVLTRSIARWSRSVHFQIDEIGRVEAYTPSPAVMVWPGDAGRQLRVVLQGRQRPLAIGEGLCLDDDELKSIEELLGIEAPRSKSSIP